MPRIGFRCFLLPNFLGVTLVYRLIEPLEEGGSVRDAQIPLLFIYPIDMGAWQAKSVETSIAIIGTPSVSS